MSWTLVRPGGGRPTADSVITLGPEGRAGPSSRRTLPKRGQNLAGESLHRAHHARVLEVAEPEAAVEVCDPDLVLHALDLADHRVGRADDQEAIEQVVG